jgi:transcriptional regulator with XRE-family HTH domain
MPFSSEEFIKRLDSVISENKTTRAEVCRMAKINHSSINNWEGKGKGIKKPSIPSVEKVIKVAEFLDISLDYLLLGKEPDVINKNEKELLELYKQLNNDVKSYIINTIRGIIPVYPLPLEQAGESTGTAI